MKTQLYKSNTLVILDNGHGINTPGKRSPVWDDGTQLFEWKFNRNIVKELLKIDSEEFGNFMRSFKATYSQSDNNDLTADEVKELILNHKVNL